MYLELTCIVDFDETVDTDVGIELQWQIDGTQLNEDNRIRSFPPMLVGSSRYSSSLQFITLSSSLDSGTYTCVATVYSTDPNISFRNSTGSTTYTLTVTGIHYVHYCS